MCGREVFYRQLPFFKRRGHVVVVSRELLPLTEGKDGYPFLEATRSAFPWLSEIPREEGIDIQFFCFDGALYSRLWHLIQQDHEMMLDRLFPDDENARALKDMSSWNAARVCSLHCGANGELWAARFRSLVSRFQYRIETLSKSF